MQVRKAVIPAAGWGTRFLPITHAYPKELLPLVTKPLIQVAVEEAVAAGIEDIVVVITDGRPAIQEYFQPAHDLCSILEQKGEHNLADDMRRLEHLAHISYVTQSERLGLGHAVLTVRKAIGDEPFAVILPDDVIDAAEPVLAQMLTIFKDYGGSVLGVEYVEMSNIQRYGIIRPEVVKPRVHKVLSLVEKPLPSAAPSQLGIVGRYILTPQVFDAIARTSSGSGGEIQLTDALSILLQKQLIYALEFDGRRFDAGSPLGWLEAQVAQGLKHPEYGDALRRKLRQMI